MKAIEKPALDYFLVLPLDARTLLEINREYSCMHDDNDGHTDQCLKMTLVKDSAGDEFFQIQSPVNPGLRFRNHSGGGRRLPVHNALKVLIYATFKHDELTLPGLGRQNPKESELHEKIEDILDGVIVLPAEVYADKSSAPNWFYNLAPYLHLGISVDGDTHILTDLNVSFENIVNGETTFWNPEPFAFSLRSGCSRAVYNSLILLTLAVKQCERRFHY